MAPVAHPGRLLRGAKGGGWFRGDLNTLDDLKGMRLRYGRLSGPVMEKAGASLVPLAAGEFFYHLQQGKVDGGEMSTPAMDAALGFDKLGLPYYMPGWQQPSSVLDFLMRKDKWKDLPAVMRAQIETACRANIAWTLSRAPHVQALCGPEASARDLTAAIDELCAVFRPAGRSLPTPVVPQARNSSAIVACDPGCTSTSPVGSSVTSSP